MTKYEIKEAKICINPWIESPSIIEFGSWSVYITYSKCVFSPFYSHSALDILWCIWGFMPPAISPTSSSCAYRNQCRVRTTSTCTSCSTRSLQACRFTPRPAQMAAAVSLLHLPFIHTCIHRLCSRQDDSVLFLLVDQAVRPVLWDERGEFLRVMLFCLFNRRSK